MHKYFRRCFYLFAFLSLGLSASWAGILPLSFTVQPVANQMAVGQTQILTYTIRNNVKTQRLPLRRIAIVNNGADVQAPAATTLSTTCGSSLAPNQSCSITVVVSNLHQGALARFLSIDYGGRAPLLSSIMMNVEQAKYTILVYIVGSDLESKSGAATDNINQMMQVGSTKNMNVVIETGGAQKAGWFTVQRKLVLPGSLLLLQDLGSISMGATSTVQDFLEWGVTNYPADKYIIVYWDHGGGPNGGFGFDEVNPPAITPMNQIVAATMAASNNTGKRFEIIGFDACLFGSAETIAGLYPYTNYYVGSEDLEPGEGWQYNTFLSYVNTHPTADGLAVGTEIVNGYTNQNKNDSTTLSVVDSAAIPDLLSAVDHFAVALQPYTNSIANWKNIARSRFKAPDYSTSVWDNESYDLVDLVEFASRVFDQFPVDLDLCAASTALADATQNAVKYFKNSPNREASFGLTVYFPSILASYKTDYPNNTSLNGNQFFSTNYINLVTAYNNFYTANTAGLVANIVNLNFDGTNYTATVSNDFDELFAAVGNDSCNNVFDNNNNNIGAVPCYTSIQYSNINSTPSVGTTFDVSFNKAQNLAGWPSLNTEPVLFIPNDTNPSVAGEDTFLIPVKEVSPTGSSGYLNVILNSSNEYEVVGFQKSTGSANSAGKIGEIADGTQFYVRTYALNGTWMLLRTDRIVTAPFSVTFGTVPNTFDAFRFLVGDITGALTITANSVAY